MHLLLLTRFASFRLFFWSLPHPSLTISYFLCYIPLYFFSFFLFLFSSSFPVGSEKLQRRVKVPRTILNAHVCQSPSALAGSDLGKTCLRWFSLWYNENKGLFFDASPCKVSLSPPSLSPCHLFCMPLQRTFLKNCQKKGMPFGPHEWVDAFWGVSILIPPRHLSSHPLHNYSFTINQHKYQPTLHRKASQLALSLLPSSNRWKYVSLITERVHKNNIL